MDKLSFFYKHYLANNPYYDFDKGIFFKWTTTTRPYMPSFNSNIPPKNIDSVTINLDAWVYSFSIKVKKEAEYAKKGKTPRKEDYPACAAACYKKDNPDLIALEYSRPKKHDQTRFHNSMIDLFKNLLGDVPYNKSNNQCPFPIGNCAEQRVANAMITQSSCQVSDLHFSAAFRPRTMEYIPACINCKTLFPQLL